jgi:hypothetical protein
MKVAVTIDKKAGVAHQIKTGAGFLIFRESRGIPIGEVVRLNPFGDHHFNIDALQFPKLDTRLRQLTVTGQAFTMSRILYDCTALICGGPETLILRRLREKGLQVILTEIRDPAKALGIYWHQIKKTAA